MKIVSVVGARPQFIKLAPLSKLIRKQHEEILIHTGQHYDDEMSKVFFDELCLPQPDINLNIGSGNHGVQTGKMMQGLEEILLREKPDLIIVFGDTNSTLAAALVAAKLLIPIAHVEAGLRSFNKKMPEEVNRILTDHLSHWLFSPSAVAVTNLRNEGIVNGVFDVGDIMYDAILSFREMIDEPSQRLQKYSVQSGGYILATIHRAENTDEVDRLSRIIKLLDNTEFPVLFPVHPRTRKKIQDYGLNVNRNVRLVSPAGYFDIINLISNSKFVVTDSGGMQKEAYYLKRSCITLRDETEWVETVASGWNYLVGISDELFQNAVNSIVKNTDHRTNGNIYGDGTASEKILNILQLQ